MWEEWEERNRLITTCKGIAGASALHASRFSSAGGGWFQSERYLKRVIGIKGENCAYNKNGP